MNWTVHWPDWDWWPWRILVIVWALIVVCWLLMLLADAVTVFIERRGGWEDVAIGIDVPGLTVGGVVWRFVGDDVEVEYSIENHRPGQTWYCNDFICVFQHGIALGETGDRRRVGLLHGARVRLTQTFETRDYSTPVIQINQDRQHDQCSIERIITR